MLYALCFCQDAKLIFDCYAAYFLLYVATFFTKCYNCPILIKSIIRIIFAVNTRTTIEIGRHRGMIAIAHIRIGSNSYEKVKTFIYLGSLWTNQNSIQGEI